MHLGSVVYFAKISNVAKSCKMQICPEKNALSDLLSTVSGVVAAALALVCEENFLHS